MTAPPLAPSEAFDDVLLVNQIYHGQDGQQTRKPASGLRGRKQPGWDAGTHVILVVSPNKLNLCWGKGALVDESLLLAFAKLLSFYGF